MSIDRRRRGEGLFPDADQKNKDQVDSADRDRKLFVMLLDAILSPVVLVDRNLHIFSANRDFLEGSQRSIPKTVGYQLEDVFPR